MAEPGAMQRPDEDRSRPWSWGNSLGGVDPRDARAYTIRRIVFDLVKDRCAELGLEEGETVRCRRRDQEHVVVELSDGTVRALELTYARFVEVEPGESPSEVARRA